MTLREELQEKRSRALKFEDAEIAQLVWRRMKEIFQSITEMELSVAASILIEVDQDEDSLWILSNIISGKTWNEMYLKQEEFHIPDSKLVNGGCDSIMNTVMELAKAEQVLAWKMEKDEDQGEDEGNSWGFELKLVEDEEDD